MKPRVAKKPTKGKRLPSQDKHTIENVRFFLRERWKGSSIRTMSVARTINWTHREFITQDYHFLTLIKQYSVSHIKVNPGSFNRQVFRHIINDFYSRKEYPTLDSVLEKVKNEC